uniref:Pyrin domain-containing protein n=1 Tax=Peromyscus maniculatus bairdii TaxID=230844 RepID=A0A8C8UQ99_PERMB
IMSKYKTIVLQQGLEDMAVDDYQFRKIKSLLRKKLNLTKKMQDDYDRIQMADQLEDTFPKDAGLNLLINVCQSIKELEGLAKRLKTERAKVKKQKKRKNKTAVKKGKQEETSSSQSLSMDNQSDKSKPSAQVRWVVSHQKASPQVPPLLSSLGRFSNLSSPRLYSDLGKSPFLPLSRVRYGNHCIDRCSPFYSVELCLRIGLNYTPKKGNLPKEPSKVEGHHRDPIQVMVLKVTEPFTYDLIDGKRMFHATVATETEFFRVKVFETALKNKFIPQKIIAISDYFGANGFLEIYGASCVSDANVNQTMVISNTLRRRANGTPKIKDLFSQIKGTYVNGEFVVTKKNERGDFIYYGIEDDTGKMEVVVYGRLTSINCEPGNKLRLVCFELTSREDTWQLKSVRHSYMQVCALGNTILPTDHMF